MLRYVSFGLFGATGISCFLLFLEIGIWSFLPSFVHCGFFPTLVELCGQGHFALLYQYGIVQYITLGFLIISPYGIASLVILSSLLYLISYGYWKSNEKLETIGLLGFIASIEIFAFCWVYEVGMPSLGFLLPIDKVFINGFISQDFLFGIFLTCVFGASLIRFRSLTKSFQIALIVLATLPIFIYFFDFGEFNLHFESAFPVLYWITNYTLLIGCLVSFSIITAYALTKRWLI